MIKKERGAITLFTVVICMFLLVNVLLINVGVMNRNASQEKEIAKISENYEVSQAKMEQAYQEVLESNEYPTYGELLKLLEQMKEQAKNEAQKEAQKLVEQAKAEAQASVEQAKKEAQEKLNQATTEINKKVEEEKLKIYPVGSIYTSTSPTNPSTFIGGTWVSYGEGRTLVGIGTGKDTNNTSRVFKASETGGEYTHKLSIAEMPSHNHKYRLDVFKREGWEYMGLEITTPFDDPSDCEPYAGWGPFWGSGFVTGKRNGTFSIDPTGGDGYHNNIQPYVTVYFWKRTA